MYRESSVRASRKSGKRGGFSGASREREELMELDSLMVSGRAFPRTGSSGVIQETGFAVCRSL